MGLLKDMVDRLLTPDLEMGGGRSIEEAILLEHAKQMDEVGALLTAEPSLDQMAAALCVGKIDFTCLKCRY